MDQTARLTDVVARLCRVSPAEISPGFSIEALVAGSIDIHLLESALRQHLDIVPPRLHGLKTYEQLEVTVLGISPGPSPQPTDPITEFSTIERQLPSSPGGQEATRQQLPVTCGLDVEHVAKLPIAIDYWAHEFYINTFSPAEIAYCARQSDPRPHFAVRWCAKEALRKCDPTFLAERLTAVQVTHDEQGAPLLESVASREILPFAVSLTHSSDIAAAVVVRLASPATAAQGPAGNEAFITNRAPDGASRSSLSFGTAVACLVALLSLIVSGIALWRTYLL